MLKIQEWMQSFIHFPLAFIDTETTGLGIDDEAFQIAILTYDKNGNKEQALNLQCRPTKKIDAKASEITGVTMSDLVNAPSYPEIHNQVYGALAGRFVIAYNAAFDRRILQQTMRKYKVSDWPHVKGVDCLMKAYAREWGEWNDYHQSYRWVKLEIACQARGIKLDNAHDAMADIQATADLFYAILNYEESF